MAAPLRLLAGIGEIADAYDGDILDQFGVLHDGVKPFADVLETLDRLKAGGKKSVVLSNAPRRALAVDARMTGLGFQTDRLTAILSSGEDAWRHLDARREPWYAKLGRACLHLGPEHDKGMLEGLDIEPVESIDDADFILNTGPDMYGQELEDFEPLLQSASAKGVPMICANPDLRVMIGDRSVMCAGAIAKRYEALGGDVRWHGKPDPSIYRSCLELLGDPDPRRVLCFGDSFAHDIRGANGVGLDSVFVLSGIHAAELSDETGGPDMAKIAEAAALEAVSPTYAMAEFRW